MGTMPVGRLLFSMAVPMMVSMLFQALYNVVDSIFVAKLSQDAMNAVSLAFPLQTLCIAFSGGTGVGMNALLSRSLGEKNQASADRAANVGLFLTLCNFALFALIGWTLAGPFFRFQTDNPQIITYGRDYVTVCIGCSVGLFFQMYNERLLQSTGRTNLSMITQIAGAATNIVLDPILIFGLLGFPRLEVAGAAIATVIGQIVAALVVMRKAFVRSPEKSCYLPHIKRIYQLGIPNILMQSAYTFYIFGLNMILAGFSDQAVTALGLYYKWQSFFFIPLGALQTCIVPVISFNYAAKDQERCKAVLKESLIAGMALMFLGTLCFEFLPVQMLSTFSKDAQVIAIGTNGFHYIGVAFIPMVTSLIFPVYFQAIGSAVKSSILTVVRTMVLFVPLGYLFSRFGLQYFWLTFPVTEVLTTLVGFKFYRSQQA